jgi:hypothetical protein
MADLVLVDSNVYISARYPQDRNHGRALGALAALGPSVMLTLNAAMEVARITREKLDEIVGAVYSRTDVRLAKTSPAEKRAQVSAVLRDIDAERRLGAFARVVEDFCLREISEGRDDLHLLPEWARDEVRMVVSDVLAFSGAGGLRELPGRRTREDFERIKECGMILERCPITGARDEEIFHDVVTTAMAGTRVTFATFDRRFATEAKMAITALETEGLLGKEAVLVIDLTDWSPGTPTR